MRSVQRKPEPIPLRQPLALGAQAKARCFAKLRSDANKKKGRWHLEAFVSLAGWAGFYHKVQLMYIFKLKI
jgi:hypothetical protein